MTHFLRTQLDDDVELLIETIQAPETKLDPALLPRGIPAEGSSIVEGKTAELESAVKVAHTIARRVQGELWTSPDNQLSEITLELALAFSAEGGIALVGKASGSASLRLTLKWTHPDTKVL